MFAKMRRDGKLVRVKADGVEETLPGMPLTRRTEAEIEAAALAETRRGSQYRRRPPSHRTLESGGSRCNVTHRTLETYESGSIRSNELRGAVADNLIFKYISQRVTLQRASMYRMHEITATRPILAGGRGRGARRP